MSEHTDAIKDETLTEKIRKIMNNWQEGLGDDSVEMCEQIAEMVLREYEPKHRTSRSYDWCCPKCSTRIHNPDILGKPGCCPNCGTVLHYEPKKRRVRK